MAFAAVPAYLGKDFSQASPGLRFGMYLPLWGVDSRSGELLWTTHDVNHRPAVPQREVRPSKDENKSAALRNALKVGPPDRSTMQALARRQATVAATSAGNGGMLTIDAVAVAPFTTGLGNEHPLENGFAFLNPYGLPYLPGSGVKGVLRAAARELASGEWGDEHCWTQAAIEALFGRGGSDGETELIRGALAFWDVIPQIAGDALAVEIMTPHQSHYLQGAETPHDSGQPNPIHFLTVPPGSKFAFHVQCDLPFLAFRAADLAADGCWQQLVSAALAHAFTWLGFGAKTAVGYGSMREDEAVRRAREDDRAARAAAQAAEREAQRVAALSPQEREAESAKALIHDFRVALDAERSKGRYKAGSAFDQQRAALLQQALSWQDAASRRDAAAALRESYKFTDWPGKKERKAEVKQWLGQLDGQT